MKRHLQRLQHHLEADPASTDAGRILRVPGATNHKTGRVATLATFTGEQHDLHAITGDLPDSPDYTPPDTPRTAKTDDELVALFTGVYQENGAPGRHDAFRSVCGVLIARAPRMPPDVLCELAVRWAQKHTTPCKDRAELERNFANLLARELKNKGLA